MEWVRTAALTVTATTAARGAGLTGIATTATGPGMGAAASGCRHSAFGGSIPVTAEAAEIQRLFAVPGARQRPGKLVPACWTSRSRFAKRRPLAGLSPDKIRAHSSVGRADD